MILLYLLLPYGGGSSRKTVVAVGHCDEYQLHVGIAAGLQNDRQVKARIIA